MINKKEFQRISKIIHGQTIYFNPYYYSKVSELINISPLIANKTLIYLTKENFSSELVSRIKQFKEEGFFIPVSISEKTLPPSFFDENCVLREKLFDEKLFNKDYKQSIEIDQQDEELISILKEPSIINRDEVKRLIDSFSFSSNWDLMFMQLFNTPLFTSTKFKPALFYKLNELGSNIYFPQRVQHPIEISRFLEEINVVFPSNLSIEQVKAFRKDKSAVQFRNWLERKLINYEDQDKNIKVSHLVQEFNKLSESYKKNNELIFTSLGGIIGGLVGTGINGFLGAAIGAPLGTISGYGLSNFFKELWKNKGPNRWVFLLTDFKKAGSL